MLGEALRLIRVYHGIKQRDLAEAIGLSPSYISEIEKEKKAASVDVIDKYAEYFDMPASAIMFFSENIHGARSGDAVRKNIAKKAISLLQFIEETSLNDTKSVRT